MDGDELMFWLWITAGLVAWFDGVSPHAEVARVRRDWPPAKARSSESRAARGHSQYTSRRQGSRSLGGKHGW